MSVAATTGTVTLATARERCAAALAPLLDTDPDVLTTIADALSPPVLMVGWTDPWLEPDQRQRAWTARLTVWCIAGRIEPGDGVATLESLVGHVALRMRADGYPWGFPTVTAPRVYAFGNVDYLGCQMVYSTPVTTDEGN